MKIVDVKRITNFCAPAGWFSRITSPDCSHFVKQSHIEQRIEALPEPLDSLLMGIREAIRNEPFECRYQAQLNLVANKIRPGYFGA